MFSVLGCPYFLVRKKINRFANGLASTRTMWLWCTVRWEWWWPRCIGPVLIWTIIRERGIGLVSVQKEEFWSHPDCNATGREGENRNDDLCLVDRVRRLLLRCPQVPSLWSSQSWTNNEGHSEDEYSPTSQHLDQNLHWIFAAWTISATVEQTQM